MKTLLVAVNIVLISTCLQAIPLTEGPIPVLPVFQQPYGDGDSTRIVSGKEATPGQFPYQAALLIDRAAFCGGSLISKRWVLTAAHCAYNFKSWAVTLGAHNYRNNNEQGRVTVTSTKGVRHEKYAPKTLSNDIAVINLPKDIAFTNRINIIKLPPKSLQGKSLAGTTARVSGWGKTSDSATSISPTLQFLDLSVISNDECASYYGAIITGNKYCGSGSGGRGTCNGDSGGSLTIVNGKNVTHIGIVSFGAAIGCSRGYPSGYTATTYFLDWISKKTGVSVYEEW